MLQNSRFMLDTNTASYIIKGQPRIVGDNLRAVPYSSVCVSAITQAELLHGVERKPGANQLRQLVQQFLIRVDILPWDEDAAACYATLRTACERNGTPLGSMDMLIAAHSMSANSVLVTSDRAFYNIKQPLALVDWTKPQGKPLR